jgi:glycosyltransferase involved in cell wall biosynthesis
VIAVPWLKVGGADRAALLHAEAMHKAGKRVLVLATEAGDSPWASRLPVGVRFLPAGAELAALDFTSRQHVLARLLMEWRPQTLHIIHSPAAWEAVRAFGRAIANGTRIYASAFCDDITPEGERVSAARTHARDCAPVLSGLLTDCQYYADVLKRDTGIAGERVHVVYLPVDPPEGPLWEPPAGPPTVLWAGRPDILAAIAERLPEFTFDVYGTQVLDTAPDTIARLAALPNVKLQGRYEGFDALPWRRCHAFLYTSQWDGLPNVLLEASVRGMPIVAPAVGGIPEIEAHNVRLVRHSTDVDSFASFVQEAIDWGHNEWRPHTMGPGFTSHTQSAFIENIQKLFSVTTGERTT